MQKEQLTNEALKKQFKNSFDLANYAINVARYFIKAGQEVDTTALLADIQKNPNQYSPESLAAMEKADQEETEE